MEQLEEEGFKGILWLPVPDSPNFMNIPGENSINIMSSNEYLTRVNLMDAASPDSDTPVAFGKNVAVIGVATPLWTLSVQPNAWEQNVP